MTRRVFNRRIISCILLLGLTFSTLSASPAKAAPEFVCPSSVTVANNADSGAGSLRQAIVDVCAGGTISFDAGLAGQTITLTSGQLVINKGLTITGLNTSPGVTVSGNHTGKVFNINSTSVIILTNLSIISGSATVGTTCPAACGGGILNNGSTLTVQNSTISGNSAIQGGGIFTSSGTVTVQNSIISGNSASTLGGGILLSFGSLLTVQNSTFSGNSASSQGGGIYSFASTITNVQNSTFSDNSASSEGGGIYNRGTLSLIDTLIANSSSGGDCYNGGTIGTNNNNLIEATGFNACGLSSGVNGNILGDDPLLAPLANNGGDTLTFALLPGSQAIDAGAGCLTTDQRGTSRPQGAHCDIGAFELVDTVAPNTSIDSENPSTTPTDSTTMEFTFSGSDATSGVRSFECDLDGGGFSACTSPKSYTGLADGSHTFQVRAIDFTGNVDDSPASFTWVVDATAPDTTILTNPANPTNNTSATFTFNGNDGSGVGLASFECDLDGGGFSACASPKSYFALSEGSHTFQVRAIDALGNVDLTPAAYTWKVDTTAPTVVSITSTAGSPTNISPIPVTISFSEPVCGFDSTTGVDLNVTNGTTSSLTSGSNGSTVYTFNLTPSGQGLVSLYLMSGSVYDGNCVTPLNYNSVNSSTFSITYDTVSPTVTITQAAGQSDPSSTSPVNFTATFDESVTGFSDSDVDLSASTTPGTLSAFVTGGPSVYNFAITGMTGDGVVLAIIPANSAFAAASNGNAASINTDNSVTYIYEAPPVITEGSSVSVSMSENGSPVPFTLTLHATDVNFDPLTWSILAPAASGTAGVEAATGVVSYMPISNFIGVDSFVVQVSDGRGGTDSIIVNVTILGKSGVSKINSVADTGDGQIEEGERTPVAIKKLLVVFTNSMNTADAQNTANYSLIQGSATPIAIKSASYDNATFTTTLAINGGVALPDGKYRLTVKGSIHDAFGQVLGADFVRTFYIDTIPIQVIKNGVTLPNGKVIANGSSLNASLTEIWVTFTEDAANPVGDSVQDDVTNPANYVLVRPGHNGAFDTLSCKGGLTGDDVAVPTGPVNYDNGGGKGPFVSRVQINNGVALANGVYKLFICGTTSITDLAGNPLNGGKDLALTFSMVRQTGGSLPGTGFAPNRLTQLTQHTTTYADLGDLWLEIPRLGVQMPIVGVPQSENGSWDVSWLGNDAGWLNGSAYPTWKGNSVLTGHVYDADGQPGPFVYLNKLWWGDQVIVHAGGAEYIYEVRSVEQVAQNDVDEMMQHEDQPWVTLVTCRGFDEASNSYLYRVLVRAVLVEVY